jgi:ATP-dependent DNA helicase RecG
MFPPEFQKPIRDTNNKFLKQAKERANNSKEEKENLLSNMEKAITTLNLNAFSAEAIQYYIARAKLHFITSDEQWAYFENIGLIERIKKGNNEVLVPTGFGILLFGKNPRENYQNAIVKAKVKYGNGSSIPKDFEGPLVLIPKDIELWLKQVLHSEVSREKFERKTSTLFPIEPLREAIINALAHRDYNVERAKTYIEIDDDKIVIKSAGLPVSPISLDDIKSFKASSLSRNPKITYILNRMGLMEEAEVGMETFREMNQKYNLPLPIFHYKAPYLTLSFSRNLEAVRKVSGIKALKELTTEQLRGYEWIIAKGEVSAKEYAENFGYSSRTVSRHFADMLRAGLLITNGENLRSPKLRYIPKLQ